MTFPRLSLLNTAITLSALLVASTSANLVLNGSFEAGATSWNLNGQALPNGIVEVSTVDPAAGTNHARMSIDNTTSTADPPPALIFQQVLPVGSIDGTKLYDFSFDAKVDSTDFTGLAAFAIVHFLDQDGSDGGGVKATSFNVLPSLGINTTYKTFSITGLDPTTGADSVEIIFQLAPGPVAGIQNALNVDNVVLQAQGGAGNSTPAVTLDFGSSLSWTPSNPDNCYQPQSSPDGTTWTDLGPSFKGLTTTSIPLTSPAPFHRVAEIEQIETEVSVNGGFEIPDETCAENWTCIGSQAATRFTSDARSGIACARLMVQNDATPTANTSEVQHDIVLAGGTIVPGASYDLSFFAKQVSSGVSYVQQFQLVWIDAAEMVIPGTGIPFKNFSGGSGSWAETTETGIVAPPEAVNALIQIFGATGAVASTSANGEVLIDDVKLTTTGPLPLITSAALNGGFEFTSPLDPFCADSWVCSGTQPATQFTFDGRTGSSSLSLFIEDGFGPNQTCQATQNIAAAGGTIEPGKSYTLSFYANEFPPTGSYAQEYSVEWRDSEDNPLGGGIVSTPFSGGDNAWLYVEAAPITAPATAATAVITFLATTGPSGGISEGEVLIDDLRFDTENPPAILSATVTTGVQLTWDTEAGTTYQPKCSTSLPGFTNFGSPVVGDGNPVTVTDVTSELRKFYQIDITP